MSVNSSPRVLLVGEAAKQKFFSLFPDCVYREDQIKVIKELGTGAYARVFLCELKIGDSTRKVAIKKMLPQLFQSEEDVLDFFRESKLLDSARVASHPNILAFIGVTFAALENHTKKSLCIIEECMNYGSLKDRIAEALNTRNGLTEKEFLELMIQVAEGLSFLHGSDAAVIHRDIKPANILLDKDQDTGQMTAKLADFGLSVLLFERQGRQTVSSSSVQPTNSNSERSVFRERTFVRSVSSLQEFGKEFISSRSRNLMTRARASMEGLRKRGELNEIYSLTGQTGSLAYMAPEVYLKKDYNHKVDVFSFAVVAFEALTRVHPYVHWMLHSRSFSKVQDCEPEELMNDYACQVSEGFRPTFQKGWPVELTQLISDCWAQNPDSRPSMSEVVDRLKEIKNNCPGDQVFAAPKCWGGWCFQ